MNEKFKVVGILNKDNTRKGRGAQGRAPRPRKSQDAISAGCFLFRLLRQKKVDLKAKKVLTLDFTNTPQPRIKADIVVEESELKEL